MPIIIAEGWDVMVYPTAETAVAAVGAIDVDAGLYRVWDAEGRVLEFEAEPPHGVAIDRPVRLRASESVRPTPNFGTSWQKSCAATAGREVGSAGLAGVLEAQPGQSARLVPPLL
jgi:hypothetical protein